VIRPFQESDAAAVVSLVREAAADWAHSPRGLVYRLSSHPDRAKQRAWVAVEHTEVVGYARARLLWEVAGERVGSLWLAVRSEARRRGVGGALCDAAEKHLRGAGARSLESFADDEGGRAFLAARRFRRSGSEHVSALDPRLVDLAQLAPLEAAKAAEGFRLLPLGAVVDRARELHSVYASALADVPGRFAVDDLRYDEWVRECLGDPDLSVEGSTVIAAAEGPPVALSFLMTDGAGRAGSDMTATIRALRRRGLARLAKLGTIRWAADNGIRLMVTGNDDDNVGMLTLNRSLGYLPLLERGFFLRAA